MSDDVRATVEDVARRVYAELGGGYDEKVYQRAMAIEFRELGIKYEVEHVREVFYQGHWVGDHRLDFLVLVLDDEDVVVELKAKESISKPDRAQLRAYLHNLGKKSGILINFPYEGEEPKICPVEA